MPVNPTPNAAATWWERTIEFERRWPGSRTGMAPLPWPPFDRAKHEWFKQHYRANITAMQRRPGKFCSLCRRSVGPVGDVGYGRVKALVADHDAQWRLRGLLCRECRNAMGSEPPAPWRPTYYREACGVYCKIGRALPEGSPPCDACEERAQWWERAIMYEERPRKTRMSKATTMDAPL